MKHKIFIVAWVCLASLMISGCESEQERIRAVNKLANIGEPAIPKLIKALGDRSPEVNNAALNGLGQIGQPAVPALIQALKHEDWWIRANAARGFMFIAAMAGSGGPAKDGVTVLLQALKEDEHPYVRARARDALSQIGEPAVPALAEALKEKENIDELTRILAGIGEPAVPALAEALRNEDEVVRYWTANALWQIGKPAHAAIPTLIEVIVNGYNSEAVRALKKIGAAEAVPALIQELRNEKSDVRPRVYAASALYEIDSSKQDLIISVLMKILREEEREYSSLTARVVFLLKKIGEPAVPALTQLLKDKDRRLGVYAAEALYEMNPSKQGVVIPVLVDALKEDSRHSEVRFNASKALEKIGQAAVSALIEALTNRDGVVSGQAASILGRIGEPAKAAVPALVDALSDENAGIRGPAACALYQIDHSRLDVLKQALRDEDWTVRSGAANVVSQIGEPARAAVPALIEALSDEDERVRSRAAWALQKIGTPEAMKAAEEWEKDE